MIKVTPLIATLGTEPYKILLSMPFDFKMLETQFSGWEEVVEDYYDKYTCGKALVAVLPNHYEIVMLEKTYFLPLPITINDFVNDMRRLEIDLYWGEWIDKDFRPQDYLPQNEIEGYYMELLTKIDKGHELTTKREGKEDEREV